MKLYQVIPNYPSDAVFAVIAESESNAIDVLIEYFNYLHQPYTVSDFSANIFDLESVQQPMVFINNHRLNTRLL